MKPTRRLLLRFAGRILAQYVTADTRPQIRRPDESLQRLEQKLQLAERARRYESSGMQREAAERVRIAMTALKFSLSDCLEPPAVKSKVSLRDLYDELKALFDEFHEVRIDKENNLLIVVTDEIELEGMYFGRFEIQLQWQKLPERRYAVVALSPNNPGAGEEYTHPHVQNDSLCEGDGGVAIRKALTQGRLYDFFNIVKNILETYNSESAYVTIEDWNGVHCSCCGDSVSSEYTSCCNRCDCTMCDDCDQHCDVCDATFCGNCLTLCSSANCYNSSCRECNSSCVECERDFCDDCIDKNDRCAGCAAAAAANPEVAVEVAGVDGVGVAAGGAGGEPDAAAVHSDSLGETAVPA